MAQSHHCWMGNVQGPKILCLSYRAIRGQRIKEFPGPRRTGHVDQEATLSPQDDHGGRDSECETDNELTTLRVLRVQSGGNRIEPVAVGGRIGYLG
jgi:hypothetical protein